MNVKPQEQKQFILAKKSVVSLPMKQQKAIPKMTIGLISANTVSSALSGN